MDLRSMIIASDKIIEAFENSEYVFFRLASNKKYDNIIYSANKKTGSINDMLYTEWMIKYMNGCREIDVGKIRDIVNGYKKW